MFCEVARKVFLSVKSSKRFLYKARILHSLIVLNNVLSVYKIGAWELQYLLKRAPEKETTPL